MNVNIEFYTIEVDRVGYKTNLDPDFCPDKCIYVPNELLDRYDKSRQEFLDTQAQLSKLYYNSDLFKKEQNSKFKHNAFIGTMMSKAANAGSVSWKTKQYGLLTLTYHRDRKVYDLANPDKIIHSGKYHRIKDTMERDSNLSEYNNKNT